MQISRLNEYIEWDKNYLFTGEWDLKYLLWKAYIEWVELLVKSSVIKILADKRLSWTIRDNIWDWYEIFDSRNEEIMKSVFSWIDNLIVNWYELSMRRETDLLNLWVENVVWQNSIINEMRAIKQTEEIELLRQSQQTNLKAFELVSKNIKLWITEAEIARLIKIKHLELGADWESFEPIVAFRENWANPHNINSSVRKLTSKDQILIDMWCVYAWYCSDMTRVIFMDDVSQIQKDLYEMVKKVTYDCMEYWKVWMKFTQMQEKAVELLWEYSETFWHWLSHSVWVEIHEAPSSRDKEATIQVWNVFSIEPGIYLEKKFWFRYEIMVVATPEWLIELK